jgi:hypothetical protein
MTTQNLANHKRFSTGYHYILGPLLIFGTIASLVNVGLQWSAHYDVINCILIAVLFIGATMLYILSRQFALKAQDRAVRAEESLRYYIITGKFLDRTLTMGQIAALRFAPDSELVVLIARTLKENLSPAEIKKEIKEWRADMHRV